MTTATIIKRNYKNLKGVDFSNEPCLVDINRSPDALNVWKNYYNADDVCIETRPGYEFLAKIGEKINGIYILKNNITIVHSKNTLYEWSNFPNQPDATHLKEIYTDMNNKRTSFNFFEKKLYINDGKNYLVYDGKSCKKVSDDEPFIPTTSVGRKAGNIGGGETYQQVNLLTAKRKNSFAGDGTSKDFYLDATKIDSEAVTVIVNDVPMIEDTDFTVDRDKGKITFNNAPSKPSFGNEDNIVITFSKNIEGYLDRINKCLIALAFNNRLFFTGNPDYPNAIFHSQLKNPQYISDLNYYEDGNSDSAIQGICVGNNVLWVFKDSDQNNANIFYHEPTIDSDYGMTYPSKQGNVSVGCYAGCTNFEDDIVYLSRNGLEGINNTLIDSKQVIKHRSSLVDTKMINEDKYKNAVMTTWNGYLCILVGGKMFLADSRQKYSSSNSFEYEWFYWDISKAKPSILKEYNNKLYIGSEDGSIFFVSGTNDNNETINSYWTTPMDNFGYDNKLKTTNKKGRDC